MPTTCEIEFENNPDKIIYAGQLLRGTVWLTLTKEKCVRSVYIQIYGRAMAEWSDMDSTYGGKQTFFDEKICLVGNAAGEFRLLPGRHNYFFQCVLPSDLSTSTKGRYGSIKYTARVALTFPIKSAKQFKEPFTVISTVDLNANAALREPVIVQTSKTFSYCCLFCCCQSNPLKIVARIPHGGYVPGQIISLELNVFNQSNQSISKFIFQLIEEITYFVKKNSLTKNRERILINEQVTRGCQINQEENILANIIVPAISPNDTSKNDIVKVRHAIRILGVVGGCHRIPKLHVPIVIGSYAFRDDLPTQTLHLHDNTLNMPRNSSIQVNSQQLSARYNVYV